MRAWMVWYYGSMYSSTYYGLCSHLRICYHTPQYTTYALWVLSSLQVVVSVEEYSHGTNSATGALTGGIHLQRMVASMLSWCGILYVWQQLLANTLDGPNSTYLYKDERVAIGRSWQVAMQVLYMILYLQVSMHTNMGTYHYSSCMGNRGISSSGGMLLRQQLVRQCNNGGIVGQLVVV